MGDATHTHTPISTAPSLAWGQHGNFQPIFISHLSVYTPIQWEGLIAKDPLTVHLSCPSEKHSKQRREDACAVTGSVSSPSSPSSLCVHFRGQLWGTKDLNVLPSPSPWTASLPTRQALDLTAGKVLPSSPGLSACPLFTSYDFCLLPSEAILRCSGSLPLSGELLPCSPAPVIGVRSPDPKASFATHLWCPLNRYSRGWGTFKGMPAGGLWVG